MKMVRQFAKFMLPSTDNNAVERLIVNDEMKKRESARQARAN